MITLILLIMVGVKLSMGVSYWVVLAVGITAKAMGGIVEYYKEKSERGKG